MPLYATCKLYPVEYPDLDISFFQLFETQYNHKFIPKYFKYKLYTKFVKAYAGKTNLSKPVIHKENEFWNYGCATLRQDEPVLQFKAEKIEYIFSQVCNSVS